MLQFFVVGCPSSNEKYFFFHFQEQERLRYCQPHKAFTFRQHGYESIVGPVKGDLILY